MPVCCAGCWFNPQSRARSDPKADLGSLSHRCEIRDLAIPEPFFTVCENHPFSSPKPDHIPIGPVWVSDGETGTIWVSSPDTEVVRQHLLDLVAQIEEQMPVEYGSGVRCDESIIWQLGKFRERRAIPHLQRIEAFNPETGGPFRFRKRVILIEKARAALAEIEGGDPPQPAV